MGWFYFHLSHLLLTATCAGYSKDTVNVYNALVLVVWWMLHQLHNRAYAVDSEKIQQSMGIVAVMALVFWYTQGRHWTTTYLMMTAGVLSALTFYGSEWVLYKDVSGALFFAASMVILWNSMNLSSCFSRR